MRLRHPDYIKLVIETYNKKRANNELSPLLAQSTPANVRRECANVYQERYERKDEQVLRAFFGPGEHGRRFLQAIQEFEADRFRPLDTYLKAPDKKITGINLELLAWLIDFRHRPYAYDKQVILNEEELSIIGRTVNDAGESPAEPKPVKNGLHEKQEESAVNIEDAKTLLKNEIDEGSLTTKVKLIIPLQGDSTDNKKKKKTRKTITVLLVVTVCLGAIYIIWHGNQMTFGNTNTGCMYWADDHYEAMPCNEERKDRLKLSMDPVKMKNFRRILKEDTITERSIGKIYYIKMDGRIEYYTTGGNHPVYVTRPLKPLSTHMFDTYLHKQGNTTKDSMPE